MRTIGLKFAVPVEAQNEPLQDVIENEEVVEETTKRGKSKK